MSPKRRNSRKSGGVRKRLGEKDAEKKLFDQHAEGRKNPFCRQNIGPVIDGRERRAKQFGESQCR